MGDSDDDGDYKRRDKFRSERRSYNDDRGGGGGGGGASPPGRPGGWREARPGPPGGGGGYGGGGGGGYGGGRRGYDGGGGGGGGYRRDRYSPSRRHHHEMSPPAKRMRGGHDWDDGGGGGYRHDRGHDDYDRGHRGYRGGGGGGGRPGGGGGGVGAESQHQDDSVQPPMMSFKAYLATQDDSITDDEAIKKYADYKLEFKRQQLNEFFVNHKDEEWFKLKYHPEDAVKRKEEQKSALMKRVDVFKDFWDQKKFNGVSIDGDQGDHLIKLLDSIVIMLEGGTEHDLKILDQEAEAAALALKNEEIKPTEDAKPGGASTETKVEKEEGEKSNGEEKSNVIDEQLELQKKAKEYLEAKGGEESSEKPAKSRKRKRTKEFDDGSSIGSSEDEDEEDEEEPPPGMDKKPEVNDEKDQAKSEEGSEKKNGDEEMKEEGEAEVKKESEDVKEEANKTEKDEDMEEGESEPKPRPLHKTASIFLRNLAPTITKQEVEAMCKKYPGFLRAAIADPQPDRRWFRRGWVTFERSVKIKEICFNLNNIRLRDCELGPIVNRDLTRRIRTVNGITVDRKIVRNDIKLAAKVVTNLDKRWNLWQNEKSGQKNGAAEDLNGSAEEAIGLGSSNPVLENITDYLIEEASAEEEELLGKNNDLEDGEEGEEGNSIVRDEELIKVLDRLLFYLRIVHSVDFYNHSEYPNEDEMPNRCGIMHARGIPPSSNVTQNEIEDYSVTFEKKMGSFLQPRADLTEDEASKLGMKNEEDEVEKFILANTQELGKDKWLCPLSGKKFKAADFVRKHIFNKHCEKIEEVKKEVQYYNNYLKDPKRPQLPENPQNKGGGSGRRDGPPPGSRGGPQVGDPYNYSGFPREATNYPVYDRPDRGYNEPRYGGDRGYRGRRPEPYGGRGRIRDRVGGPPGGVRVTQIQPDPRGTVDYGDVDFGQDVDLF
ncbi:serrate RNA effector molecule homolog isoform X2 [Tigriopus californicus]|uniref:serrate RNA effector molecule homolog isoform X2 n=1 Tax=Tigriopus californicus TaxID=6832 RepID=UPI0027D9CEA1|nr:serrate RNA effector molecule homolog isoform X2 [Tigriopus californicus]